MGVANAGQPCYQEVQTYAQQPCSQYSQDGYHSSYHDQTLQDAGKYFQQGYQLPYQLRRWANMAERSTGPWSLLEWQHGEGHRLLARPASIQCTVATGECLSYEAQCSIRNAQACLHALEANVAPIAL